MPWNTVTTDDVLSEFTPVEQATLEGIQGVSDSLDKIVTKVVAKVRGQIKAGGNQLDMTGQTVPDSLQEECIALARWRWLNSFPALTSLKTKERKEAYESAQSMLKEISSNEANRPRTELPEIVDTTPAPVGGTTVKAQKRKASHRKLSGLI